MGNHVLGLLLYFFKCSVIPCEINLAQKSSFWLSGLWPFSPPSLWWQVELTFALEIRTNVLISKVICTEMILSFCI